MVGYYKKFVNRFSDTARPRTNLSIKNAKFEWSQDCQTGFQNLMNCFTKDNIFKYPDPSKRYVIFIDASD